MKRVLLVIPPMVAWLKDRTQRQKYKDPGETGAFQQAKPQSRSHRPKLNRRIAIRDTWTLLSS